MMTGVNLLTKSQEAAEIQFGEQLQRRLIVILISLQLVGGKAILLRVKLPVTQRMKALTGIPLVACAIIQLTLILLVEHLALKMTGWVLKLLPVEKEIQMPALGVSLEVDKVILFQMQYQLLTMIWVMS